LSYTGPVTSSKAIIANFLCLDSSLTLPKSIDSMVPELTLSNKGVQVSKNRWQCSHEVLDPKQVHYCRYIGLEALLALARPHIGTGDERDFIHEDEPQFIAAHQMSEIGFALHIQTLGQLIGKIEEEDYPSALKLVERLIVWCGVHGNVMSALNTMEPKKFFEFRDALAPASGAESEQYRIIEILSGIEPEDAYASIRGMDFTYRAFLDRKPEEGENKPKARWWTLRLTELSEGPTVRKAIKAKLQKLGIGREELFGDTPPAQSSIALLAQGLVGYDKAFRSLRSVHMMVAARQIGTRAGTGHTDGVPYLKSAVDKAQFFPELWDRD